MDNLLDEVRKLNDLEFLKFKNNILEIFKNKDSIQATNKAVQRVKHCPNCKSEKISQNGSVRGKKRFVCKSCNKFFTPFTGTILNSSKIIPKIHLFIDCLIKRKTYKETSKICNISEVTISRYRKLILQNIEQSISDEKFCGIIETDETYLSRSFKGQKKSV